MGVAAPLGAVDCTPLDPPDIPGSANVPGFEPRSSPYPANDPLPIGDVTRNASATALFLALLAARPATAAAMDPDGASLLRFHIAPHPRLWTAPGSIR